MTTPAPNTQNPGVKFEIPVIPNEFGEDGGEFIRRYDALADEIDDDMVKGLKEQLDGLLIFAGLFAGVNSAFLALTLPLMSPDPADDTNALLRENNAILLQLALGRNDSLPSAQALPSETFSPAGQVLSVNVLFSVSLTLALISSFMAVLGRQWLVYYRKRTGGGPERQRWEQLKRFLGAERWGLEWALDDFLPSILQIGLIIFCISLTIYLNTLHPTLSNVVGTFMCAGLAIFIITAVLATWDKFCPFQSPLSHLISLSVASATRLNARLAGLTREVLHQFSEFSMCFELHDLVEGLVYGLVFGFLVPPYVLILVIWDLLTMMKWVLRNIVRYCLSGQSEASWSGLRSDMQMIPHILDLLSWASSFLFRLASLVRFASQVRPGKRQEEDPGKLQIFAIRRAICTSDDALTLLHGVSNILAISDSHLLDILAADDEFTTRLSELWRGSYSRTLQLRGRDQLELARRIQCLYRAALAHVLLSPSAANNWDRFKRNYDLMLPSDKGSEEQRMLSPSDLVQHLHSNMINAYLSCGSFDWAFGHRKLPGVNSLPPPSSMDVLLNPTWRCISIVLGVIVEPPGGPDYWNNGAGAMRALRRAYAGDPCAALEDLESVMRKCSDFRTRESRDTLKQYLVPIFKFAGKAAVDSVESRGIGTYPVAKLLRLSETFMRAEDSPSNFINIGRSLRRDLISVLATVRERSDLYYEDKSWLGTLDQLIGLFTDLTKPSQAPTISSNDDGLDLVSLFTPILRHLQAVIGDPGWVDLERGDSVRKVNRLDELFRGFKAAVESDFRKIKVTAFTLSSLSTTLLPNYPRTPSTKESAPDIKFHVIDNPFSIHETAQCASSWECVKAGGINHVLWPLMGLLVIASILLGTKVDEADPDAAVKWGISGTGAMAICGVCVGMACASTARVVELVLPTLTLLAFAAGFIILRHRWGSLCGLDLEASHYIDTRLFDMNCFLEALSSRPRQ
ncbi:hypothetical protein FRC04_001077 [Tulasnella sp. 424]|nr:hypothetical protein FRC04_001077 [Tulasnella sp. 424]